MPPTGVAVTVPSQFPTQLTPVPLDATEIALISVIVTKPELTHPPGSVTVTVLVPAFRPVAVTVVCELGSSHKMEKGETPPKIVTVASPSLPPLQETMVLDDTVTTGPPALSTDTNSTLIHPLASVTVALNTPATNPTAVAVD